MEKNVENPKRGYLAASIAGFITTALLAVMLGLTAAVAWLTQLTGSLVAASLVIGGFFAVIAAIIYRLSIRDAVEQLRIINFICLQPRTGKFCTEPYQPKTE